RAAHEAALAALSSPQARALMIDFNEWLQSGSYRREPALGKPVVDFAAHALDRQRKRLMKNGKDLAGLTDGERHQIRKDAKKLRYAAEFFCSLFEEKRGARRFALFSDAMEKLQDRLGALNDLVTGPDVAAKYGLDGLEGPEQERSPGNKTKLIERSQAALDDLLDAKKFWR
ncbi:MAG: CHAD domain-containing protein, partial [Rhizobiaceae bacterium]